jgi:site-specific DNA recombinase
VNTFAIYTRISADKGIGTDDEGLAVDRQETAIRSMLEAKGLTAGKLYCDNSFSATNPKKPRPAYIEMMKDWEAGEFEGIAAFDLDRLSRTPREIEDVIDSAEKRGLLLATVSGDADLSTDNGRLFARIKAAVAKAETERRAFRQKAKFAQDRETGKHHWRGRRPFGLELDGSLNLAEAKALQDVATMILKDENLSACVRYLNDSGIETSFGGQWARNPLKRVLLHPRLIAKMEHKGELIPGNWQPVLEESTWLAIGQILTDPTAVRRNQTKHTDKEYLLSGVAVCDTCEANAYGTLVTRAKGNRQSSYAYRCSSTAGHFSKTLARTDQYVVTATLGLLMLPRMQDNFSGEGAVERLQELREARTSEVSEWSAWQKEAAEEGFRPAEYRAPRERHERTLAEIDAEMLSLERTQMFTLDPESTAVVHNWESFSLARRRAILRTVWKEIRIKPSRKGARWTPDHIELVPSALTSEAVDALTESGLTP